MSLTTSRLNPSCLLGVLNAYGGGLASPVPGFQIADTFTYPLMVVEDSAVRIGDGFSSAINGIVTKPAAASAKVHFCTLVCFIPMFCWLVCFALGHNRIRRIAATAMPGTVY